MVFLADSLDIRRDAVWEGINAGALHPSRCGAPEAPEPPVEERRKRLAAEGLFDAARKQLLPFLPTTIGVVTSPTTYTSSPICISRMANMRSTPTWLWPPPISTNGRLMPSLNARSIASVTAARAAGIAVDAVVADSHRVPGAVWSLGKTLVDNAVRKSA